MNQRQRDKRDAKVALRRLAADPIDGHLQPVFTSQISGYLKRKIDASILRALEREGEVEFVCKEYFWASFDKETGERVPRKLRATWPGKLVYIRIPVCSWLPT